MMWIIGGYLVASLLALLILAAACIVAGRSDES